MSEPGRSCCKLALRWLLGTDGRPCPAGDGLERFLSLFAVPPDAANKPSWLRVRGQCLEAMRLRLSQQQPSASSSDAASGRPLPSQGIICKFLVAEPAQGAEGATSSGGGPPGGPHGEAVQRAPGAQREQQAAAASSGAGSKASGRRAQRARAGARAAAPAASDSSAVAAEIAAAAETAAAEAAAAAGLQEASAFSGGRGAGGEPDPGLDPAAEPPKKKKAGRSKRKAAAKLALQQEAQEAAAAAGDEAPVAGAVDSAASVEPEEESQPAAGPAAAATAAAAAPSEAADSSAAESGPQAAAGPTSQKARARKKKRGLHKAAATEAPAAQSGEDSLPAASSSAEADSSAARVPLPAAGLPPLRPASSSSTSTAQAAAGGCAPWDDLGFGHGAQPASPRSSSGWDSPHGGADGRPWSPRRKFGMIYKFDGSEGGLSSGRALLSSCGGWHWGSVLNPVPPWVCAAAHGGDMQTALLGESRARGERAQQAFRMSLIRSQNKRRQQQQVGGEPSESWRQGHARSASASSASSSMAGGEGSGWQAGVSSSYAASRLASSSQQSASAHSDGMASNSSSGRQAPPGIPLPSSRGAGASESSSEALPPSLSLPLADRALPGDAEAGRLAGSLPGSGAASPLPVRGFATAPASPAVLPSCGQVLVQESADDCTDLERFMAAVTPAVAPPPGQPLQDLTMVSPGLGPRALATWGASRLACCLPLPAIIPAWPEPPHAFGSQADLWRCFDKSSLFGQGFPRLGGLRGPDTSFFLPFLSAVHLYVPAPEGGGSTAAAAGAAAAPAVPPRPTLRYLQGADTWPSAMQPLLRWQAAGHMGARVALADQVAELCGGQGEGHPLMASRLVDLHPYSWVAVAWYPLYSIPEAPLAARFLTFHSLAPAWEAASQAAAQQAALEGQRLPRAQQPSYRCTLAAGLGPGGRAAQPQCAAPARTPTRISSFPASPACSEAATAPAYSRAASLASSAASGRSGAGSSAAAAAAPGTRPASGDATPAAPSLSGSSGSGRGGGSVPSPPPSEPSDAEPVALPVTGLSWYCVGRAEPHWEETLVAVGLPPGERGQIHSSDPAHITTLRPCPAVPAGAELFSGCACRLHGVGGQRPRRRCAGGEGGQRRRRPAAHLPPRPGGPHVLGHPAGGDGGGGGAPGLRAGPGGLRRRAARRRRPLGGVHPRLRFLRQPRGAPLSWQVTKPNT